MALKSLLTLSLLFHLSSATYVLEDDYSPDTFFSMFSFFTSPDPTHGYVDYVDQSTALSQGLIHTGGDGVIIGVDSSHVASGPGRKSVRIMSNKSYNHGLFILDLAHMPGGVCGTWPAYWLLGPEWPNEGEIDIIEGVNDGTNNALTLHTSDDCSIQDDGSFTGTVSTPNCYINAPGQSTNAGCDIQDQDTQSYGAGFNVIGGGIIATEWTSSDISIWFFPRGTTPADITAGDPDPSSWTAPVARFQWGCDIDSHFQNQQIVFDTTFCGDWAGNVWSTSATCSSLAPTCQDYVQNNPTAFANAYWKINSLKVYRFDGVTEPATHLNVVNGGRHKNHTLPLLTTPLAMGGGLPPKRGKDQRRSPMSPRV